MGGFGYNCGVGKCDFVRLDGDVVDPHVIFYGIACGVPCLIIITSYTLIWKHARHSSRYLRKSR